METIQSKANQGRVADAPSGHWVYRVLPRWLWPYAQLARWDRPIGWQLLLWQVGALIVLSILSMGLDRLRRLQNEGDHGTIPPSKPSEFPVAAPRHDEP